MRVRGLGLVQPNWDVLPREEQTLLGIPVACLHKALPL